LRAGAADESAGQALRVMSRPHPGFRLIGGPSACSFGLARGASGSFCDGHHNHD